MLPSLVRKTHGTRLVIKVKTIIRCSNGGTDWEQQTQMSTENHTVQITASRHLPTLLSVEAIARSVSSDKMFVVPSQIGRTWRINHQAKKNTKSLRLDCSSQTLARAHPTCRDNYYLKVHKMQSHLSGQHACHATSQVSFFTELHNLFFWTRHSGIPVS